MISKEFQEYWVKIVVLHLLTLALEDLDEEFIQEKCYK